LAPVRVSGRSSCGKVYCVQRVLSPDAGTSLSGVIHCTTARVDTAQQGVLASAAAVKIRYVRGPHGGTPNLCTESRAIVKLEF